MHPIDRTEIECSSRRLKLYFDPDIRDRYNVRWNVGGYGWVVRHIPYYSDLNKGWVAFRLVLVRKSSEDEIRATLRCQLVDESGILPPFRDQCVAFSYKNQDDSGPPLLLVTHEEILKLPYLKDVWYTVECTISVHRVMGEEVMGEEASNDLLNIALPSTDLHQQLGELLQSQKGADVTFVVSGESFTAHKVVLAARSPIFMAEFFGHMKESVSNHVEIKGIEPAAFKAFLHFIYTDTCTELTQQHASDMGREAVTAMAQHLLAAADRYGLDRLKMVCEDKLCRDIDVDMVATTLALADQHGCSRLKKRCIEFIVASPLNLDAVMASEGYKHLMANGPFPINDVLRAAVSRR